MKTKLFLSFIAIFLYCTNIYPQNLNFFAQLIGKWEATYDDMSGQNETNLETWNVQWILNKYFIEIDIHGVNSRGKDMTYDEKYIITLDENSNIIGWGFDANPNIYFMSMTGKNFADGVKMKGKVKNHDDYDFTLELKEGKLMRKFKDKSNDIEVAYLKK